MAKKYKYEFPKICNRDLHFGLHGMARGFIMRFTQDIIPLLRKLGICNDETISRIMFCNSMETIYAEALRINGEDKLNLMEDIALSNEIDLWKPLRAAGCKVLSPRDSEFVFAEMPLSDCATWQKDRISKAIRVKNCKLILSEEIVEEQSIYEPTDRQREIYDLVADFCNNLKAMGIKCDSGKLFTSKYDDYLRPNAGAILYFHIGIKD